MLQLSHNDGFPLFVEPAERGASTLPHFSYNTNPGNRGFRRVLLFLLPALTFLSSNTVATTTVIAPELRRYVSLYLEEAEKHRGIEFRLKLESILENHIEQIILSNNLIKNRLGQCSFPQPEIGVKGVVIVSPRATRNKMVIFHELTHCLLNLGHAASIPFMNPVFKHSYIIANTISPSDLELIFARDPSIPRGPSLIIEDYLNK